MANPVGIGYPDGQRVSNLDGPLVINTSENNWTGAWSPPANIDVSRYDGIQVGGTCTLGAVALYLQWSADQAGQIILGERTIVISANMGQRFAFNVRNLGPWLNVTVTAIQAQASTFSLAAMPSNRTGAVEAYAAEPILISVQGTTVNPGVPQTFWPSSYYGGPIRLWANPGYAGCRVFVRAMQSDASMDDVDVIDVTQNTNESVTTVAPLGAWCVEVDNNGAAGGTIYLAVSASPTGSL